MFGKYKKEANFIDQEELRVVNGLKLPTNFDFEGKEFVKHLQATNRYEVYDNERYSLRQVHFNLIGGPAILGFIEYGSHYYDGQNKVYAQAYLDEDLVYSGLAVMTRESAYLGRNSIATLGHQLINARDHFNDWRDQ